jgi:hypothetical protein
MLIPDAEEHTLPPPFLLLQTGEDPCNETNPDGSVGFVPGNEPGIVTDCHIFFTGLIPHHAQVVNANLQESTQIHKKIYLLRVLSHEFLVRNPPLKPHLTAARAV